MNDLIALLVLAAAFGAAVRFHAKESAAWRGERADLLNRLMARTYTDFVYTTKTEPAVETSSVAPQPPDMAWHEENRRLHPDDYPEGVEGYE